MASIVYDNFKGGLDLRKNAAVASAAVQLVLNNAYISTGYSIKKRPCLTRAATLEAGTVGLKAGGGVINTFYESGAIVHADPRFLAHKAPHPTLSQAVKRAHFAETFIGFLYAALEYSDGSIWHQYFDGTVPPRVTDVNCPQTNAVRKLQQKIYAKAGSLVRFSKTGAARDWTTANDAGFLACGAQAAGSDVVTALGDYLTRLIVLFDDGLQKWLVDPDPANMALETSSSLGTNHRNTTATLAGDLILLSKPGFRSVSQTQFTPNFQENDVGSPIDALRGDIADDDNTIMVAFPVLGQLWTINGGTVYVYSFSRTAKLSAWSVYTLPIIVEDATVLNNELYLRSGDDVYLVDKNATADIIGLSSIINDATLDPAGRLATEAGLRLTTEDGRELTTGENISIPLVEIHLGYQSNNLPGILKIFSGFDIAATGSPEIAFKWNPNNAAEITDFVSISGDTRPGDLLPMELSAVSIAPCFRHQLNEAFELNAIQLYYDKLGPV